MSQFSSSRAATTGMIFFPEGVSQDDDAKIVRRNPCLLQSEKLYDSVIFAVGGTNAECGEGQTPDIFLTID